MRFPRTLSFLIVREVVEYALLGFLAFSTILVTQNLLRRLDDLVGVGFHPSDLVAVLACLAPMLAAYALPISFLFGVLLAIGRMSSDSEITAMRACGLGVRELVLPVLAVGVVVSLGTAWLLLVTEPSSRTELRRVLRTVASRGALLDPGRFRVIGDRVVLVGERDLENRLRRVLVVDRTSPTRPFLVVAESGRFRFDEEHAMVHLELETGDVHLEPTPGEDDRYRQITFDRLDYAFDASVLFALEGEQKPADLSTAKLLEVIALADTGAPIEGLREKDPLEYRLQLHRRLALPIAPVLFALVGVPLGLRGSRGARSWGTLLCVALVFGYYALLSLAQFLARNAGVPPAPALWLPNLAFALLAIPLLRRARRGEI
jgi:lipopolysaccharide export system permease protein